MRSRQGLLPFYHVFIWLCCSILFGVRVLISTCISTPILRFLVFEWWLEGGGKSIGIEIPSFYVVYLLCVSILLRILLLYDSLFYGLTGYRRDNKIRSSRNGMHPGANVRFQETRDRRLTIHAGSRIDEMRRRFVVRFRRWTSFVLFLGACLHIPMHNLQFYRFIGADFLFFDGRLYFGRVIGYDVRETQAMVYGIRGFCSI